MKKFLAVLGLLVVGFGNGMAASDLESAFKEAKIMGQFRAFYIDRDYNQAYSKSDRSAFAIGGKFGFETGVVNGLKFGIMAYSTNGVNPNSIGGTNSHMDPTLFGKNRNGVTYIGQLYLNYSYKNTNLKVGRQEINTPMAGMDDARMLPNLFEGAILTNKDLSKTTLIVGHLWSMAYGTFANSYGACTKLAIQAGYGCGGYTTPQSVAKYDTGEFMNMGKQATGENTAGVSVLAVMYDGIPNLKLQAWDYIAWDIANIVYLQGDYTTKLGEMKTTLSAQYINQTNIGDNVKKRLGKDVGANLFGVRVNVNPVGSLNIYGAYSITGSDTDKALNGGLITPWGGTPGFVQGTVTRLGYVADTSAYKVGFNAEPIKGLNIHMAYSYFNVGSKADYAPTTKDAKEYNWDLTWKCRLVKNLEFRARGIYARDFIPGQNFDEYRLIANYNF